jgi:glutamate-ammonia-ligase adenylyltransferase
VRKLINWLTVKTGEGDLYEIDTALRPNGNAGLLITSFAAYANYQQQRGSNTAWTWEHQAITRARCVLGDDSLRTRFDAVRKAVITAVRNEESLRTEISAMRNRVASAHPARADKFDVKYSPGAMMDAEFVMQFLVLSQSGTHPELMANAGNIALLERAELLGLLPDGVGHAAASAYRVMRQVQHRARLNEESPQVDPEALNDERQAILTLWHAVFTS